MQPKFWVCQDRNGNYEIIRAYGSRPLRAICESPSELIELIDLKWFYIRPWNGERVDLADENQIPANYYLDYTTTQYHTPVPSPIPRYVKDENDQWVVSDEYDTNSVYTIVSPTKMVEAVINQERLEIFQEQQAIKDRQKTIQRLTDAVQRMLDAKAQEKGYDSALSCVSYVGATGQYGTEANAMLHWRTSVWAWYYDQLQTYQGQPLTPEILIADILNVYPAPW